MKSDHFILSTFELGTRFASKFMEQLNWRYTINLTFLRSAFLNAAPPTDARG